jgi:hypothetical protein
MKFFQFNYSPRPLPPPYHIHTLLSKPTSLDGHRVKEYHVYSIMKVILTYLSRLVTNSLRLEYSNKTSETTLHVTIHSGDNLVANKMEIKNLFGKQLQTRSGTLTEVLEHT